MRPESTSVIFRDDLSILAKEYDEQKAIGRFIARQAAPVAEVASAEGQYPIMNRENFKKPAKTGRTEGSNYNRVSGTFGSGTYDCQEHGLEYVIDDRRLKRYRRLFDAELAATQILRFQLLLAHERRVAALYSGGGFSNTNVATAWSTSDTAVPLDDILTGLETLEDKCGVGPEDISLIIPRADFREMMACAQVTDKVKYTYPGMQPALLQAMQVAAMLGIKSVLKARSVYDSTEEGVAESNTQIWTAGVMYLAVLAEESETLETASAARTILWTADAPELPVVESYREEKIRSDVVRTRDDTDEILMGETDLFVYQLTNT